MTQQGATPEEQPAGGHDLRRRMVSGVFVSAAGMLGVRLLGLVNIAFLGRLLTPGDFGIAALAMLAFAFIEAVNNNQFNYSLIQRQASRDAEFDTNFTLSLIFGIAGAVAIWFAAGPFAEAFREPALVEMLRWLSVASVIGGLRNAYFTKFQIEVRMGPGNAVMVIARAALTFTTVVSAFWFRDYRAIILGFIVYQATNVLLTYWWLPRRPRLSLAHWREQAGFGIWLSAVGIIDFLARRLPAAMLGRYAGTYQTGLFHMGNELATTFTQQLFAPLYNVLMPGLSAIWADAGRRQQAYLKMQESLLGVTLPTGFGLALLAPELVRLVLGTQWGDVVPILVILAPVTGFAAVQTGGQAAIYASGHPRALFVREVVMLALLVPLMYAGFHLWGVIGVVSALAVTSLLRVVMTLWMAARLVNLPLIAPVLRAWRSCVATVVMQAVLLALFGHGTDAVTRADGALLSLLGKLGVGALVYVATHLVLWRLAGRPEGFETTIFGALGQIRRRVF